MALILWYCAICAYNEFNYYHNFFGPYQTESSPGPTSSSDISSSIMDEKSISSLYNQVNYSLRIKKFLLSHPKAFPVSEDSEEGKMLIIFYICLSVSLSLSLCLILSLSVYNQVNYSLRIKKFLLSQSKAFPSTHYVLRNSSHPKAFPVSKDSEEGKMFKISLFVFLILSFSPSFSLCQYITK